MVPRWSIDAGSATKWVREGTCRYLESGDDKCGHDGDGQEASFGGCAMQSDQEGYSRGRKRKWASGGRDGRGVEEQRWNSLVEVVARG